MNERELFSLRGRSRLAGLFLLLATVALYVSQRVVGASATVVDIQSHDTAYDWAGAVNLIGVCLTIAAVTLLDDILRPVNARLSRLAAFVAFVGCVIQAFMNVFLYGALWMATGTPYREAFYLRQYQALAHLLLSLYQDGYLVTIVFFGLYGVLIGYFTRRSGLLPNLVAELVVVLALGCVMWALPALAGWSPIIATASGFSAQLTLSIALLAMGLNERRWKIEAYFQPRIVA